MVEFPPSTDKCYYGCPMDSFDGAWMFTSVPVFNPVCRPSRVQVRVKGDDSIAIYLHGEGTTDSERWLSLAKLISPELFTRLITPQTPSGEELIHKCTCIYGYTAKHKKVLLLQPHSFELERTLVDKDSGYVHMIIIIVMDALFFALYRAQDKATSILTNIC